MDYFTIRNDTLRRIIYEKFLLEKVFVSVNKK